MKRRRIWIDLDNSPHVPFFAPIIGEFRKDGHEIILTARDSAQVMDLVALHGLDATRIGGHFGKNKLAKVLGTLWRAIRLALRIRAKKPDMAVSHGSRSQLIASVVLGIPSVVIFDYEFTSSNKIFRPTWVMAPEAIPPEITYSKPGGSFRYPGIKEDVYASRFKPDLTVRQQIGFSESDFMITIRPPASEAHYHNPASDELLFAVVDHVIGKSDARIVLLPRTPRQVATLSDKWAKWISNGRIVIPGHAVDGLSLIWSSDLVISGGGTMNREAAALGVPVYSIFRGRTGAVDRYLESEKRLVLVTNTQEILTKLKLIRRERAPQFLAASPPALEVIMSTLYRLLES